MRSLALLFAPALLAFAPAASAQSYEIVSFESFEYPVGGGIGFMNGGIGWENDWWSGGNGDDAIVTTGGCDNVGDQATINFNNAGSYRKPDRAPHPDVVDPGGGADGQDAFGLDGSTLWISVCAGRSAGSDDRYGGFSLFDQGFGERLYLGSPFDTFEWGLHDDPMNNPAPAGITTVPGSDVDVFSTLVYRIDFMAGMERLRMWIDPASDHPSTTPDIDVMIADLRFNEIRIQSGEGPTANGYDFDALTIEKEVLGGATLLCFGDGSGTSCGCGNTVPPGTESGCENSSGVGGVMNGSGNASFSNDTFVLTGTDLLPFQPCLFFQGDSALNGGNGVTFGDGIRCCGDNVVRLVTISPDANGCAATDASCGTALSGTAGPISQNPANGALMIGQTKCYQCWYRDPINGPCGNTFNLTNAAETTWSM